MAYKLQSSWVQGVNTLESKRRRCTLKSAMGCTVFIVVAVLFWATNLVKWNTDVVYFLPETSDLTRPPGREIPVPMLHSPEWTERKTHIIDALESACSTHGFSVTTHKSLRVLGAYVHESIFYVCSQKRAFANAKVESLGASHLVCRETYGNSVREMKRPNIKLKAFDLQAMKYVEEEITAPDLVCSISHGVDVVNSNWRI